MFPVKAFDCILTVCIGTGTVKPVILVGIRIFPDILK